MPRFLIVLPETYYNIAEVEAESKEAAINMFDDGDIQTHMYSWDHNALEVVPVDLPQLDPVFNIFEIGE